MTGKHQIETAESAHSVLVSLSRHAFAAAPGARDTLLRLALAAALHPTLEPFRTDPLKTLGGNFVSVDAYLDGIRGFIANLNDRDQPLVGTGQIRGTLYLPAENRSVVCHIFAARDTPADEILTAWLPPLALHPVSLSVAESANAALRAAVDLLERTDHVEPLLPASIHYQIVVDPLDSESTTIDTLLAHSAGDSLGLPLALAFVSALADLPLRNDIAATGAIGRQRGKPQAVAAVGWQREKRAALPETIRFFLAPEEIPDDPITFPVTDLQAAVQLVLLDSDKLVFTPQTATATVPPSGRELFFLLTDLEDATLLWDRAASALQTAVKDWTRLVEDSARRTGGFIFRTMPDEARYAIAFSHPEKACRAALLLQKRAIAHPWLSEIARFAPRIALHGGAAPRVGNDYTGRVLSQARVLLDACHPGQIVATRFIEEHCPPEGKDEIHFESMGSHRLPDLAAPLDLFVVWTVGLPQIYDSPRTLDARKHNLPVQITPLLGRAAKVRELSALLQQGDERLVTLTGPGGVGKTRLALQVAAESMPIFPNGVWFVSLAQTQNGGLLGAVEETLRRGNLLNGVAANGINGIDVGRLAEKVGDKRFLLLLDNCESCLDDAPFVGELLQAVPGMVCLATSRFLLNIANEKRVDVLPLTLPDNIQNRADVEKSPAVRLFVDRARAVRDDWQPVGEDWATVARICRRVDALPLGIELAAAHIRRMPLGELEIGLGNALALLTTRLRNIPEQQRGLRATVEWSYNLLDEAEQRLLCRVSVMNGEFDRAAARMVYFNRPDTDDLLARLEESSLLQCRVDSDQANYRMLNLIREFAREKLQRDGLWDDARRDHAAYCIDLANRLGSAANQPNEVIAFDRLEAATDDFRAAFDYLKAHDPARLPDLIAPLGEFLHRRGMWRERGEWLPTALEAAEMHDASPTVQARLHIHLANLLALRALPDRAEEHLVQAMSFGRRTQDRQIVADTLNLRGVNAWRTKRFGDAIALLDEAAQMAREIGNSRSEIAALNNKALAMLSAGDRSGAQKQYEETLALCIERGDLRGQVNSLNNCGHIVDLNGEYPKAKVYFERSLAIARKLKDTYLIALPQMNLGDTLLKLDAVEDAVPLLAAAESLFQRLEHPLQQSASRYLESCKKEYGTERLETVRREFARQNTIYLQNVDCIVQPPTMTAIVSAIMVDARD